MGEQRRTGRAQIDILLNKYVAGVPYTARACDISPGGVRLSRLLEPEHSGRRVGLQFQLPGSSEVIYAEGEVVREWVEAERAATDGVRFTLLTERHRQLIRQFVESSAAKDDE
jgi:PilZ domain